MRATVLVRPAEHGYELLLGETPFELVKRVMLTYLDSPRPPAVIRILIGSDKSDVLRPIERAGLDPTGKMVRLEVSLAELHSLHAGLVCASAESYSEEAFYIRIGFFRENVLAVARGIVAALENCVSTPDE